MIISSALTYKESIKSAKRTAVSVSSFGASLGFHATTNRTDYHKGNDNMIISSALTYKESIKSAKRTAVSVSSFGASLGFHATTNRTDADFTL